MKRLSVFVILGLMACSLFAQNNAGSSNDEQRIAITPYISSDVNFSTQAQKKLLNIMNQMLTANGMAGTKNQRFIITANIEAVSENVMNTTTTLYEYRLNVNFYIGDGVEGRLFNSISHEIVGVGETKGAAYTAALSKIKPKSQEFQGFVAEAKSRIIEYYNSQCDFIIQNAQTLASQQKYDEAIYELTRVPNVCKDCYGKCMTAVKPIFQAKIDVDGKKLLAKAKSIWAARQDIAAADEAGAVLAKINPESSIYPEAMTLSDQIAKRVKELDNREWNYMLKQQQDQVDIEKASIKAVRDIGVAYGNHQQPVTYNIRTWW